MLKFGLGFLIGFGVGAGVALLMAPRSGDANREQLRVELDRLAAEGDTPVAAAAAAMKEQRDRLSQAIDAGRRASAARQAELWAQLNLTPPDEEPPAVPPPAVL